MGRRCWKKVSATAASARVREIVEQLTDNVVAALMRRQPSGGTFHIEDVQDQVELALMRSEHPKVARAYVLYREEHARARGAKVLCSWSPDDVRIFDGAETGALEEASAIQQPGSMLTSTATTRSE